MATRPADFGRFFHHYRKIFVFLGCLLAIQVFLAVRIIILHAESSSGSGSNNNGFNSEVNKGAVPGVVKAAAAHDRKVTRTVRSSSSEATGNYTSLDKSNLPFDLPCEITSRESISAINRAKTTACKETLAKTACQLVSDTLYPKRLPRLCVNNVTTYGRYVGCFRDDKKNRILADALTLLKDNNSAENCVDLCLQAGFQYAGVQYSIECFCGNQKPSSINQLPDKECNMQCPSTTTTTTATLDQDNNNVNDNYSKFNATAGSSSTARAASFQPTCGGFFAMSVYETGVFHEEGGGQVVPFGDGQELVEKRVRIVFLLTLNGRAFRQVIRLIKSLFHQRHFFYIHVDARQDYLFRELLVLSRTLPNNVRFMSERRATIWGGASLLTVLLSAMEDLVTHAEEWNWSWDYVINLSESDFPLKTTERLETFLSLNNGKNFIKSHGRDVQKFIQKQGLDKTFVECEYRMWRIGDRTLPKGILVDGGSDWIALHRDLVEYITKTEDQLVRGLKVVFKHTLLPAESFFHTVVRNSAMCSTFVDNNLHVTNWKRKLGCKCQYRNIVDWCGCSPNDFRLADWSRLQLTENRLLFFGRKFEPVVNQAIINKLENWLYPDRFSAHASTADRYWQSIYHHYDLSPPADDAVLTLGHSLARLAAAKLTLKKDNLSCTNDDSSSSESNLKLLEMHIYAQNDQIEGILVKFRSQVSGSRFIASEALFSFIDLVKEETKCELEVCGRIRELQVGLDYDQKEQIFRHFSRVMGPFSEPVLAYNSVTDTPFNITFKWINPKGSLRAVNNVTVSEGSTANFIKPHLGSPLSPGNWIVKILAGEGGRFQQLLEIEFLIVPLQFYKGVPITSQSSHDYLYTGGEESQRGNKLTSLIDSLISRHYSFVDICLETEFYSWSSPSDGASNELEQVQLCKTKGWSSMYPDPKSTIEGVDELNGFLVP